MKILFLTLVDFDSIYFKGLYEDLIRTFDNNGHQVSVISPVEKRTGRKTELIQESCTRILKLRIGNVQKTNLIEKGISTLLIEPEFIKAIKQYFSDVRFDLVLYSTPPITFLKAVEYVKKRDNAKTFLLLKDIFPQNAVDIGMMSKTGPKGILYRYFRSKEKKLYAVSDRIGCMSEANVLYLLRHNAGIDPSIVSVCPNSCEIADYSVGARERKSIRQKYDIPEDKVVFVYGGNLGKPQDIPFLIRCLHALRNQSKAFFLIIGSGTEYLLLEQYMEENDPSHVRLFPALPKEDYDAMIGACDVGLIFLDHRFTIPNFPSRLLSYMQAKLPVLAATDPNTDIGQVITDGDFGWWCESNDVRAFAECVKQALKVDRKKMGKKAFQVLKERYDVRDAYQGIVGEEKSDYSDYFFGDDEECWRKK